MTGYDVQQWITVTNKLLSNGLTWNIKGEFIHITDMKKLMLGSFDSVSELYNYLCGYEAGYSVGEAEGF
jgi:hypothetical protein